MKELAIRALTGAVYVAVTLGAAIAGPFTTFLLFLPVSAIAAVEYHRLHWREQAPPAVWGASLTVATFLAFSLVALLPDWPPAAAALSMLPFVLLAVTLFMGFHREQIALGLGALLVHIVYLGLPFAALPHLVAMGTWTFIGFMLLLWANDTGAYLVGRAMGRIKLMPSVSPKKTVEGVAGGALAALLVAWALGSGDTGHSTGTWLACAVVVTCTGTVGDLLESALKRAAGVKDSGKLMPGHGGLMDRFDGLLLAAPAVLLLLSLLE